MRVAVPAAVDEDVAEVKATNHPARQIRKPNPAQALPAQPGTFQMVVFVVAILMLVWILAMRRFAPELLLSLDQQFNPLATAPVRPTNFPALLRAEEDGVTAFFTAFQAGPPTARDTGTLDARLSESGSPHGSSPADFSVEPSGVMGELRAKAAKLILTQRSLLQEINRASDAAGQQKLLAALRWEMHAMKGDAGLPRLLPVWQVASALEGLLQQLTAKLSNITPSTLRTVAAGVDLLADLCCSEWNSSLVATHPMRLLVVDDDSISRNAIATALKRAFDPPDLAEDAKMALALASTQPYDVVFLDVQGSGVDRYEFCSRIHETIPNRTAMVVFVTDLRDFAERPLQALGSGDDMIGKPFLTFEITLKVLTLALHARLRECAPTGESNDELDDPNGMSPAQLNSRSDFLR